MYWPRSLFCSKHTHQKQKNPVQELDLKMCVGYCVIADTYIGAWTGAGRERRKGSVGYKMSKAFYSVGYSSQIFHSAKLAYIFTSQKTSFFKKNKTTQINHHIHREF